MCAKKKLSRFGGDGLNTRQSRYQIFSNGGGTTACSRCSASDSKINQQKIELPENIPRFAHRAVLLGGLYGVAAEQQILLEMQDTAARLEREGRNSHFTRNHLAALVAKDTFNWDTHWSFVMRN